MQHRLASWPKLFPQQEPQFLRPDPALELEDTETQIMVRHYLRLAEEFLRKHPDEPETEAA